MLDFGGKSSNCRSPLIGRYLFSAEHNKPQPALCSAMAPASGPHVEPHVCRPTFLFFFFFPATAQRGEGAPSASSCLALFFS